MSSFLSNKYLQYRNWRGESITISGDRHCVSCGYNVRGLKVGQNCPECGTQIRAATVINDPLLAGEWNERQKNLAGLMLIALTLIIVPFARLGLVAGLFASGFWPGFGWYLYLGMALSLAWIIGTWLLTEARFDSHYNQLRWLRRGARWLAFSFLPGYVFWLLALTKLSGTQAGEFATGMSLLLRTLGTVGVAMMAVWLLRLANDAELEDASRRIYLAIWMLPLPTIILALIPAQIPWIFWFLVLIPLLLWCWYVLMLGRGVLTMQKHVAWSMRIAADLHNRDQRQRETRRELEEEANARVRAVQRGPSQDVPLN